MVTSIHCWGIISSRYKSIWQILSLQTAALLLQKDRDDEEFMAMYEQYEAFDELEEQFMDMEESVTARIAEYVDNHIEEFAEIV